MSLALRHHHTSLFVTDLDRSIAFYRDVLGFELLTHEPDRGGAFLDLVCNHPDTRLHFSLLRLGSFVIELMVPLSPADLPSDANAQDHGIARIGFEVEDIEAVAAHLQAHGVELLSEIATLPTVGVKHYAGGKAVFFKDPDGIILELQQPARPGAIT